jgi:hypothetical protein
MADGFGAARLCLVIETESEEDNDIRDFGFRKAHGKSLMAGGNEGLFPPAGLSSFELFDFQDHFGSNGSFLVEHGIGESLFDDGTDFSGDTKRDIMDSLHGTLIQDGLGSACQFHVMIDVSGALFWIQSRHVVSNGDPLIEGFHDGKVHGSSQIALTGKYQDEGVV